MKKINFLIITLLLISLIGYSQKSYKKSDWKLGEVKFSGSNIKRVEGENNGVRVTNIGYQSSAQLIAELKQQKKEGKIGGSKYKQRLSEYENKSIGGMVYTHIERKTATLCDNSNFVVVVKDATGKEIKRKQLRAKTGKPTKNGKAFKVDGTVFIQTTLAKPFTVEVVEKTTSGEKIFLFEIK